MKIVLAAVLGFSALLGGGIFYSKGKPVPSAPTKSPISTEVISVPSSSTPAMASAANSLVLTSKSVVKQNVDKDRVLYLNNEVTFTSAQALTNKIKELNAKSSEDIYLLIDSPGGSVLDGATLISEMEASKAHVNTVCTRLCASMAAMIHSYGHKRYGTDRSILMYHPASAGAQGQVPNMLSQLTTMTRYIDKMVSNAVSRSKVTPAEFEKLVAYELWIDAEDSTARGLNDGIIHLNVPNAPTQQISFSPGEDRKRTNQGFQWISPHLNLWERQ